MAQASGATAAHGESFFSKFTGALRKLVSTPTFEECINVGRTAVEMPDLPLAPMQSSILACSTGPGMGVTNVSMDSDNKQRYDRGSSVAGVVDWIRPHPRADGASITLYERKTNSAEHHGDPIADAYAVIARPNSCILAIADGVNWGPKPRLAARCALHGCIEHLNSKVYQFHTGINSTQELFHSMLRSLDFAQKMILSKGGTTTTLTVAMVCQLAVRKLGSKWGLCVVSVGDSPCFIYKQEEQKVYEVTAAIHSGQGRDPRDPGGCLGANLGDDPDLSNLICCFVPVAENDIIFLTSDGISDNFDPVTLRTALPSDIHHTPSSSLPVLSPEQRQTEMLSAMKMLLSRCSKRVGNLISVHDLMNTLIAYAINTTDQKRTFMEQAWIKTQDPSLTTEERRAEERKLSQESKTLGGKLDHATVVGFCVGELKFTDPRSYRRSWESRASHIPQDIEMHETSRAKLQVPLARRADSIDNSLLHRLHTSQTQGAPHGGDLQ